MLAEGSFCSLVVSLLLIRHSTFFKCDEPCRSDIGDLPDQISARRTYPRPKISIGENVTWPLRIPVGICIVYHPSSDKRPLRCCRSGPESVSRCWMSWSLVPFGPHSAREIQPAVVYGHVYCTTFLGVRDAPNVCRPALNPIPADFPDIFGHGISTMPALSTLAPSFTTTPSAIPPEKS
jgi:hypothetical protein